MAKIMDGDSDKVRVEVIIAIVPISLTWVLRILHRGSERQCGSLKKRGWASRRRMCCWDEILDLA